MDLISKVDGFKPLLYLNKKILLSAGSDLYISDIFLKKKDFLCSLSETKKEKILANSPLLSRLTRHSVGPAQNTFSKDECIVWFNNRAIRINTSSGKVKHEPTEQKGRAPLQMTKISLSNFKTGLYFGEYFSNPQKKPVDIWYRSEEGKWRTVYRFKQGLINHIHSLYQDVKENCIYILTGDYGNAACIWKAENNFTKVERWLCSGQLSRSCWVIKKDNEFFYATDSHIENNYFCSASQKKGEDAKIRKHFPTVGSSIYHTNFGNGSLCFSTAVEPPLPTKNKLFNLINIKRGDGILSDYSCIYYGNVGTGFDLILKAKKDFLPPRLFGFGSFQFPSGDAAFPDIIHAYGQGLTLADNTTFILKANK